jgi:hypothetical protein
LFIIQWHAIIRFMSEPIKKLCFIIGPLGKPRSPTRVHADTLLRKIIRPTFRKHFPNFIVERSDDIARPGMIDSQVITQMLEADLVIADLTERNANAFYEMGIRHLHHKPIIHVAMDGEAFPFDVATFRTIVFSYHSVPDITDAKKALRRFVAESIKPGFKVENPVTRSAGYIALQQWGMQKEAKGADFEPAAPEPPKGPRFDDAPGLVVRERSNKSWAAWWQARSDLVKAGFKPKIVPLWIGIDPSETDRKRISDSANTLQKEMLAWARARL